VYQRSKNIVIDMKPSEALNMHRESIRRIITSNRTLNPRVFGSVANGTDTDISDLDILVDATSKTTLMDIGMIRHQLLNLLKIPVDVLTPKALPEEMRSQIISEAIPL
jgi:predicted nucleotidyltransferase